MQTILITGAKGFVGTHLRAALKHHRPDARVVPLALALEGDPDIVAADLLDPAAIDAAVAHARPDVIIHLAAQASVAGASGDNENTYAVNLGGSLNLALAVARHAPGATLLFASSSEVYGASFLSGIATEATAPLPLNVYARSKLLAEQIFAAVLPDSAGLIIARPFNHTGAGQREDFVLPSFAAQVARVEAGRQKQVMVGNLDVIRDFLDVRDVVDAYLALIETPNLPRHFTCNIASGIARPLRDILDGLLRLARVPIEIVVDASRLRTNDTPVALGDPSLIRASTGWAARRSFEDTLSELLVVAREREAACPSTAAGLAP